MRMIEVEKCRIKKCPYYQSLDWCWHPKWKRAKSIDADDFFNDFPVWCSLQKFPEIRRQVE
jgi:hypothetical protein